MLEVKTVSIVSFVYQGVSTTVEVHIHVTTKATGAMTLKVRYAGSNVSGSSGAIAPITHSFPLSGATSYDITDTLDAVSYGCAALWVGVGSAPHLALRAAHPRTPICFHPRADGSTVTDSLVGVRRSLAGVWHHTPDDVGALVVDPTLLESDLALNRLIERVVAVRGLALAGAVPVADLASQGDRILLLASIRVAPTVLDLTTAVTGLNAGAAAVVASDVANTLLAVHQAGLTHGAFGPECVVISVGGAALLNESASSPLCGVATARPTRISVPGPRWCEPLPSRGRAPMTPPRSR